MISFFKAAGSAAFASVLSVSAHAAIPLYTVDVGITVFGQQSSGVTTTITQSLTLTESYNVTALGLLDSGFRPFDYQWFGQAPINNRQIFNQGFFGSHTVSLLNSSLAVVAQTTFAPGLTGYTGPGTLPVSNVFPNVNVAQFRYIDIAPTLVSAGNYSLVSTWAGGDRDGFQLLTNSGYTAATGATLGAAFVSITGPVINFSAGVSFAGNLLLEPTAVSPIPEPSEVAMMIAGLGVLGAIARRRKTRESTADAR
jgi:hypothetical protein